MGAVLPVWSALPFAGLLLSIALLPLFAPGLWHHHFGKVTAGWSGLVVVPLLLAYGETAAHELVRVALVDYVPFLLLLATLFTIGGGIHVAGTLRGTPGVNAALLGIGTLLASWVGTTGAAMVLVRPLLRANRARHHRAHTLVFFIFLVANVGGGLTPLGDPPLFLGFLHGVPFFWTLRLWRPAAVVAAWVLGVYFALDLYWWRREPPEIRARTPGPRQRVRLEGAHNLIFLVGVVAAVILSGTVDLGELTVAGIFREPVQNLVRDVVLLLLLAASWRTTSPAVRARNEYSWAPIREVAILFAGIFATMMPVLAMLRAGTDGALAFVVRSVTTPARFFWASGGLSSFLDNAPTYLTFLSAALGRLHPGVEERMAIGRLIAEHPAYLAAIAAGSVFMGANTYIGNAPNFMVKSIAEDSGVPMPSFFGYMFGYSIPVLLPVFGLITWIFFV